MLIKDQWVPLKFQRGRSCQSSSSIKKRDKVPLRKKIKEEGVWGHTPRARVRAVTREEAKEEVTTVYGILEKTQTASHTFSEGNLKDHLNRESRKILQGCPYGCCGERKNEAALLKKKAEQQGISTTGGW